MVVVVLQMIPRPGKVEALQCIILRTWLEEGSCGGGGTIFQDPTLLSSLSSMNGMSMMDPALSSLSMDGTFMFMLEGSFGRNMGLKLYMG